MKLLKTILILLVIVAFFGVAMFALNLYTAPIIEANNAGAANERLNSVMPGGVAYEDITAILKDLPANVVKVNKETSGLGYVIECTATSQYTGSTPMDIVIGVDLAGKICGIQLAAHSESLIFGADYPSTYIGKDSALSGVELYAGSTFSSKAFKAAVEEGMGVLIFNDLIKAGVKSDAQILEELIPTVAPGYTKLSEVTASGNIQKAMKSENNAGFAYIMTSGDESYLAVVNAMGVCKVYDVNGNDVSSSLADLIDEAKAHATANQKDYATSADGKFSRLFEGATNLEAIALDEFSSVVYAVRFNVGDSAYYGFYARPLGFDQMDIYIVVDENGAISKLDAAVLFFETEYFPVDDEINENEYEGSFIGSTGETFTGENAMISGATMTSDAVKKATKDAFNAFDAIKEGEQ